MESPSTKKSKESSSSKGLFKKKSKKEDVLSPSQVPGHRIFVRRKGKENTGKILVIRPDWSFEELLEKLGEKYHLHVSDVYLDADGELLQVDAVEEIEEGDQLVIEGTPLKQGEDEALMVAKHQLQQNHHQMNGSSGSFSGDMDLSVALVKLTHQMSRLITRMDQQATTFEEISKKLTTALDQQRQSGPQNGPIRIDNALIPRDQRGLTGTGLLTEFKRITTFTDHGGPIWSLKVTSDLLFSGSSDKTIKVWDLTTLKLLKTLEGHTGIVHCLAVSKGRLISGSDDKSIRIWSLHEMKCIRELTGTHDNTICEVQVTDRYLFSGSYSLVHVWDIDTFELITTLTGYSHWVYSMCLHDKYLFSGSHNMIKIWDIETLKDVRTIVTKRGKSIYSLAVAGNRLLAGTFDNSIFVFNATTFEFEKTLTEHQACVLSLCVRGQLFFSGSYDTTLKVWSVETLSVLDTLHHQSKVESLVATDKYLISGGTDSGIKIWSWKRGTGPTISNDNNAT
eukprot:TRINITY_DN7827_c0_g1_i1.p1 TRINITY_DN7827_c0_g1~~TRINITY_DN7827_c0_g1_i1.p1  ORF type:complete len:508 (-),score=87.93 TRINITY_DN7827_c0_g1_i1:24-1547(-)